MIRIACIFHKYHPVINTTATTTEMNVIYMYVYTSYLYKYTNNIYSMEPIVMYIITAAVVSGTIIIGMTNRTDVKPTYNYNVISCYLFPCCPWQHLASKI